MSQNATQTEIPAPQMSGDLDHPHVRAVLNYQLAVARGDLDSARTVFAPDVRYVVPGRNPLSGAYHGPDEVMGYFGPADGSDVRGTYQITRMHWMTSEDHVTLLIANSATVGRALAGLGRGHRLPVRGGRKKRIWHLSG
jgi:hypothetical protein